MLVFNLSISVQFSKTNFSHRPQATFLSYHSSSILSTTFFNLFFSFVKQIVLLLFTFISCLPQRRVLSYHYIKKHFLCFILFIKIIFILYIFLYIILIYTYNDIQGQVYFVFLNILNTFLRIMAKFLNL